MDKENKQTIKSEMQIREEKIKMLINKGYTCNPETGDVFGMYGKLLKNKNKSGYTMIKSGNTKLRAHHLIWYLSFNEITDGDIDHINGDKSDNRISNLRHISHQKNTFNRRAKGYCFYKKTNKWIASIKVNYKSIHLGLFNTEEEAKEAYLNAKKIYHII